MAIYVKGDPVANATSYELFKKAGSTYTSLATANEINFEVSALGLSDGNHTLVVKAKADGYVDSDYSNEVVYTIAHDTNPVIDEIFNNMEWTIGKTPGANSVGLTAPDARYVCMTEPYDTNGETITINNPNTSVYQCNIGFCDENGAHTEYDVSQLIAATWTANGNIRLCFKFADNRDMTDELWQTLKAEILAAN